MTPKFRPNIIGQWDTFDDWVNRASRDIGARACPVDSLGNRVEAVCIDSNGKRCHIGADFKHARFPVYFFWDCKVEHGSAR